VEEWRWGGVGVSVLVYKRWCVVGMDGVVKDNEAPWGGVAAGGGRRGWRWGPNDVPPLSSLRSSRRGAGAVVHHAAHCGTGKGEPASQPGGDWS